MLEYPKFLAYFICVLYIKIHSSFECWHYYDDIIQSTNFDIATFRFRNFSVSKLFHFFYGIGIGFGNFWYRYWFWKKLVLELFVFGLFLSILDPKCWTWLESYESRHYNNDIIQSTNFDLKSFRFGFHVFLWNRFPKKFETDTIKFWNRIWCFLDQNLWTG